MWNDARTTNLIANTLAVLAVGPCSWRAWRGWRSVRTSRCQPSNWSRCRTASCTMSRRARCARRSRVASGQLLHRGPGRRPLGLRVGALGAACHRAAHLAERAARAHRGTAAAGAVEREPDDQHLGRGVHGQYGRGGRRNRVAAVLRTRRHRVAGGAALCRAGALVRAAGHARQATRTESPLRLARRAVQRHVAGPGPGSGRRRAGSARPAGRVAVRGAHSTFCAGVARRGRTPGRAHHHPGRPALSQWFRTGAGPVAAVGNQVQIHTETSQKR